MVEQVKQLDFSGKEIFVGIDVHKKQWTVTIRFNQMEQRTFSMNPSPKELRRYLQRHYPDGYYHSVYEAGFCGFWIHRQLKQLGIDNRVVNPADVPTCHKERDRKTDRVDSRKLCRELEHGSLVGIYIPSEFHQELRSLNRLRRRLVQQQTRTKCRIKGYLNYHGIPTPAHSEMAHWSGHFIQWLHHVKVSDPLRSDYLTICLQSLADVRQQLVQTVRRLRYYSYQPGLKDLIHHYFNSIPGIGFITAMTIYSEVMDIRRFATLDALKSFFGLVPSTRCSDEREKTKGLSHRRNAYLRYILIESAWVAARKDPALSLAFAELSHRMPPQQAIIRIARKLLNRIRYVWIHEKPYEMGLVQ